METWLMISPVVLSGIIPMVFVMYITGPFVNYIHLRLPPFVRTSHNMLMRYSKVLPKDAEIDVTTMNAFGKPQVVRMRVVDLYPVKERFGLANYARDTREINDSRKWWMGKATRQFGVHGANHGGKGSFVGEEAWVNMEATIAKRVEKGVQVKGDQKKRT
jgi:hypothetical protein